LGWNAGSRLLGEEVFGRVRFEKPTFFLRDPRVDGSERGMRGATLWGKVRARDLKQHRT
jgi:hypothetical protein